MFADECTGFVRRLCPDNKSGSASETQITLSLHGARNIGYDTGMTSHNFPRVCPAMALGGQPDVIHGMVGRAVQVKPTP